MGTWHCKDIGDGVAAFAPAQKLHDQFVAISIAAGDAARIWRFLALRSTSGMVTWYFSPEASILAKTFSASPCRKTRSSGWVFL